MESSKMIDDLIVTLLALTEADGTPLLDKQIEKDKKLEAKKEKAAFKNDCNMWILQLKAFVLDTLIDEDKANSQTFLNFLDELNKISVIV
jgi:hypothetical protein